MSNQMDKVLKELTGLKQTAGIDLQNIPLATRSSIAIAIQEAKKRLEGITTEYKEMLRSRSFTIFTEGAEADQAQFAKIAQEEGDVVVVSSREVYQRLARACNPTLGAQRQFGGTALNHLIRAVEEVAVESGNQRLTAVPRLLDIAVARTFEDVVEICRSVVLADKDTNLNKDYMEHLAFKRAFENEMSEKVIPIVVIDNRDSVDFGIQSHMFTGRGFVVKVPENVDKEFVLAAFKRVIVEVSKAKKQ